MPLSFESDPRKNTANRKRHGVDVAEALTPSPIGLIASWMTRATPTVSRA